MESLGLYAILVSTLVLIGIDARRSWRRGSYSRLRTGLLFGAAFGALPILATVLGDQGLSVSMLGAALVLFVSVTAAAIVMGPIFEDMLDHPRR